MIKLKPNFQAIKKLQFSHNYLINLIIFLLYVSKNYFFIIIFDINDHLINQYKIIIFN